MSRSYTTPNVRADNGMPPDIRIGLVGLRKSGKTHFVAMLKDAYLYSQDNVTVTAADKQTAYLFHKAREPMLMSRDFLPASPPNRSDLYRVNLEKHGIRSYTQHLEILDVAGELFLRGDEQIYSKWLTSCNAILVLIDGQQLAKDIDPNDQETAAHLLLFRRVLELVELYLEPVHKNKRKIFIGACVSKYDLFERPDTPGPSDLVRSTLASIHNVIESMKKHKSGWASIGWYGFSSIGFLWNTEVTHYVGEDGNEVREGQRLSQLTWVNGKARLLNTFVMLA